MTTYYTIQTWRNRAFEWETFNLYETFDEACDTIEGYMKAYADFDESEFEKIKPNREEKLKNIESWNRVSYLKMPNGEEKYIAKMKVVPKKETNKYVYQYWVENKICGLHTKSGKYASFDEACDALDRGLSELYEVDGKKPLQGNRLVIKTLLEKSSTTTYAYYNDGGSTTDKYILSRQEV